MRCGLLDYNSNKPINLLNSLARSDDINPDNTEQVPKCQSLPIGVPFVNINLNYSKIKIYLDLKHRVKKNGTSNVTDNETIYNYINLFGNAGFFKNDQGEEKPRNISNNDKNKKIDYKEIIIENQGEIDEKRSKSNNNLKRNKNKIDNDKLVVNYQNHKANKTNIKIINNNNKKLNLNKPFNDKNNINTLKANANLNSNGNGKQVKLNIDVKKDNLKKDLSNLNFKDKYNNISIKKDISSKPNISKIKDLKENGSAYVKTNGYNDSQRKFHNGKNENQDNNDSIEECLEFEEKHKKIKSPIKSK
jgi:hypothetical protein